MGSDYLFSSEDSRKPISKTVSSSDRNQSPETHERRNRFNVIFKRAPVDGVDILDQKAVVPQRLFVGEMRKWKGELLPDGIE